MTCPLVKLAARWMLCFCRALKPMAAIHLLRMGLLLCGSMQPQLASTSWPWSSCSAAWRQVAFTSYAGCTTFDNTANFWHSPACRNWRTHALFTPAMMQKSTSRSRGQANQREHCCGQCCVRDQPSLVSNPLLNSPEGLSASIRFRCFVQHTAMHTVLTNPPQEESPHMPAYKSSTLGRTSPYTVGRDPLPGSHLASQLQQCQLRRLQAWQRFQQPTLPGKGCPGHPAPMFAGTCGAQPSWMDKQSHGPAEQVQAGRCHLCGEQQPTRCRCCRQPALVAARCRLDSPSAPDSAAGRAWLQQLPHSCMRA